MIKIGILGDIGSGKSFVAKQFNCPVFNADKEVTKIYKKNRICFKKLKKQLPKYISFFPIKKNEIEKAILGGKKNLKKIIKIVHPIVRVKMNKFFIKNRNKKIVVLDIPLLIENRINSKNYILIFVDSKNKDILRQLKKRPNYNPKIIEKFKKLQLPLEIKKKKSDFIIKNNFKNISIKKSVKIIKSNILKK